MNHAQNYKKLGLLQKNALVSQNICKFVHRKINHTY